MTLHLIGLVFKGGLGIPLFCDEMFENDEEKSTLIYSLSSAITSFASGIIGEQNKGRAELISGEFRVIVYDPFVDLISESSNIDRYVLMALQDIYDNLEISFGKLTEIHRDILYSLGLSKPDASIGFFVPAETKAIIEKIALRTMIFPEQQLGMIHELFSDLISSRSKQVAVLALILADIDGGLLQKTFAKDLYEDPAFTELKISADFVPLPVPFLYIEIGEMSRITQQEVLEETVIGIREGLGEADEFDYLDNEFANPHQILNYLTKIVTDTVF